MEFSFLGWFAFILNSLGEWSDCTLVHNLWSLPRVDQQHPIQIKWFSIQNFHVHLFYSKKCSYWILIQLNGLGERIGKSGTLRSPVFGSELLTFWWTDRMNGDCKWWVIFFRALLNSLLNLLPVFPVKIHITQWKIETLKTKKTQLSVKNQLKTNKAEKSEGYDKSRSCKVWIWDAGQWLIQKICKNISTLSKPDHTTLHVFGKWRSNWWIQQVWMVRKNCFQSHQL